MRPGYIDDKDAVQKRLRRIEGQVRGLQRMVDEDRYCIEILEQVSAATKALQAVALELLDDHLAHCVSDAVRKGGDEATEKLQRGVRRDRPSGPLLIAGACHRHLSCSDVGRSPPRGLLHVLGDAVAARPRVRPLRRRPVLREPRRHATAAGRPPGAGRRHGPRLRHGLVVVLLRRLGHGQVALRRRAPTTSPPWSSCSPRPTWCIELGIVLVVLMGWQFAVSEFVGGVVMIVLLATLGCAVAARAHAWSRRGDAPCRR